MDRSVLVGLVIGGAAATAAGAYAGYQALENERSAVVLSAEPVMRTVRTPREVCNDEVVTTQAPTRDTKRVTGAVVGAVVGGVLGNQVGDGSGQTAATVAGAAAGGYAGSKIQKQMQKGNTQEASELRCTTVYDSVQEQVGYDVRYRFEDEVHTLRMDHDPGDRLPVEDGEVVIAQGSARDG